MILPHAIKTPTRRSGRDLALWGIACLLALAGETVSGARCTARAQAADAPPVRVEARIAPSTATVGDRLRLDVTVDRAADVRVEYPDIGGLVAPLEIQDAVLLPEEERDGRVIERRIYALASFETGPVRIPVLPIAYATAEGETATAYTDSLAVTIESVIPEEDRAGQPAPRDIKGPIELPRRIWPWVVLAAAAAAALIAARYLRAWWLRRGEPVEEPVIDPIERRRAAHLVAFGRLDAIRADDPIGRGDVPGFYVRVTDVFRRYIGDRYDVPAIDMTTAELEPAMIDARLPVSDAAWARDLLTRADLSKFAKFAPTPEEARADFDGVRDFVERTRFHDPDEKEC